MKPNHVLHWGNGLVFPILPHGILARVLHLDASNSSTAPSITVHHLLKSVQRTYLGGGCLGFHGLEVQRPKHRIVVVSSYFLVTRRPR